MSELAEADARDGELYQRVVESALRLGLLAMLGLWCFQIIQPFIGIIMWGAIIAVATFPLHQWLVQRPRISDLGAALIIVALMLVVLIAPSFMIADTFIDSAQYIAKRVELADLNVPPPDPRVAEWPVVGGALHDLWAAASTNLQGLLGRVTPQLRSVAGLVLKAGAGAMTTVFVFVLAVLLAGVLLARHGAATRFMQRLARRVDAHRGLAIVELATQAVRSVAQGVIGIALIQGILSALGMIAIGVPGAALLALMVMFVAIAQLPPMLILGAVTAYVFYAMSTPLAIGFFIFSVLVSSVEMILKPFLFGRGTRIPMLVILFGALGGMLSAGVIGLFVGAVVLAVGYEVLNAWLDDVELPGDGQGAAGDDSSDTPGGSDDGSPPPADAPAPVAS